MKQDRKEYNKNEMSMKVAIIQVIGYLELISHILINPLE